MPPPGGAELPSMEPERPANASRLSPAKIALFSGAALVLAVALALVLFEIGVRAMFAAEIMPRDRYVTTESQLGTEGRIHDASGAGVYAPHPTRDYAMKPEFEGTFRRSEFDTRWETNARGFRDEPFSETKPEGTVRIAVLGDSLTVGHGVEAFETYSARLPDALRARWPAGGEPPAFETMNFAVSGYAQVNQLPTLREDVVPLRPDVVVVGFAVKNDPLENAGVIRRAIMGSKRADRYQRSLTYRPVLDWLAVSSAGFMVVKPRVERILMRAGIYERSNVLAMELGLFEGVQGPEQERLWLRTSELLGEMADVTRALGAELVVALVPTDYQVRPQVWERVVEQFALNADAFDMTLPSRVLTGLAEVHGFHYVDTVEALRAAQEARGTGMNTQLYYPVDRHLTPLGHEAMADAVASALAPLIARDARLAAQDAADRGA